MATVIEKQSGAAFVMKAGQKLKVIDPHGKQVSDLFCFSARNPTDSLSAGRSIDYNDTIFLSCGHTLYSHASVPMMKIVEDTCGRHDFLLTPCSQKMFEIVSGSVEHHNSCHENLAVRFNRFGIPEDKISTTFNIFMNVQVNERGQVEILPPLSRAGDYIVFEALTHLVVGLTACSHEATNGGSCKEIHYEIS